jgi:hypothetical protein
LTSCRQLRKIDIENNLVAMLFFSLYEYMRGEKEEEEEEEIYRD